MATAEMELDLDGTMDDDSPDGIHEGGGEEIEIPHVAVEEKRVLKAVGLNAGRSDAKKALDAQVNRLENEGWQIEGFGHTEKFDKDLNIIHTFTATLKKVIKISTISLEPLDK